MKNRNNLNRNNGKGKKLLNAVVLYTAMGVAGTLAMPTDAFSQTKNSININTIKTKNNVSVSDYQKLIKERDVYIKNNWNRGVIDPNEYFVLNQKELFEQAIERNTNGTKEKLKELSSILENKFNESVSENYIINLGTALKIISTENDYKDFSILTSNLTGTFSINFIDAYGYIETNIDGIKKGYYNTDLPIIELSKYTLDRIIYLLKKGKYDVDFVKAKQKLDNKEQNKIVDEDKIEEIKNPDNNGAITEDDLEGWFSNTDEIKEQKIEEQKVEEVKEDKEQNKIVDEDKTEEAGENPDNNGAITEDDLDDWFSNTDETKNKSVDVPVNDKIKEQKIEEPKVEEVKEEKEQNQIVEDKEAEKQSKAEQNMSIGYDFKNKLDFNLGTDNLLIEINYLIKTYPIIKDFVGELKNIDVNFDNQDETNVNQTALILEFVNGDYNSGYKALNYSISKGQTKSVAILSILKDLRHNYNTEKFQTLQIVNNMLWDADVLSKKLDSNKLNNISYQEIVDVVSGFKSKNLQKAFMYQLLNNDIVYAQELMGMSIMNTDHYHNYMSGKELGKIELKKIKRLGNMRKYMQEDEILDNKYIPQDVKTAYKKFVDGDLDNKGLPYSILSKTDMKLYFFSDKNILLSGQKTLIGKHIGDQKNSPPNSKTTPGGMYQINERYRTDEKGKSMFDKYDSHYITLYPLEGQYIYPNNSGSNIGVHGLYNEDKEIRTKGIKSSSRNDHRMSAGCINIVPEMFGGAYNHFKLGSSFYVTKEPNGKELGDFRNQLK